MCVYRHSVIGDVLILGSSGASRISEGIAYLSTVLQELPDKYYLLITDFGTDLNPDLEEARQLASYVLSEEKLHNVMSISVVKAEQFSSGKALNSALAIPEMEIEIFKNENDAIQWLQARKAGPGAK